LFFRFSEIQLKTPNWLFGQRKHAEPVPTTKVVPVENANEGNKDDTNASICGELNWLSSSADLCEEDNFRRFCPDGYILPLVLMSIMSTICNENI
jgi:hypothetical protein